MKGGSVREEPSAHQKPGNPRLLLRGCRLYLVTPVVDGLDAFLGAVLEGGVDIVQLRDKRLEARELLAAAAVVRRRTSEAGALFVVNDRVDLAIAAGADGVHLGQADLPVRVARAQLGPEPLIGLSTHRFEEWGDADPEADYLGVGPVFATPTKPGRPAVGLELVNRAAGAVRRPWFAIGGIDQANIAQVVDAGATRVAVVRALTDAPDPSGAAAGLLRALRTGRSGSMDQ